MSILEDYKKLKKYNIEKIFEELNRTKSEETEKDKSKQQIESVDIHVIND